MKIGDRVKLKNVSTNGVTDGDTGSIHSEIEKTQKHRWDWYVKLDLCGRVMSFSESELEIIE